MKQFDALQRPSHPRLGTHLRALAHTGPERFLYLIGNSFDVSSCVSDDLPKALLCLSGNIFSCPAIRFSSALLLAALPRLLIALVRLLLTTLVGIVCLVHALLFLPHANQTSSSIGMFRHAVMLHPAMSNDIHGFGS